MRNDVQARSALLVVLGLRNTTSARRPVHRDVVRQRDGSVAPVNELAPLLVRSRPPKPRLGILQDIEGSVPHPGYAGNRVPLPLAVASSLLPLPGDRVLFLLDPAVFYVAGQVELIRGPRSRESDLRVLHVAGQKSPGEFRRVLHVGERFKDGGSVGRPAGSRCR